MSVARFLLFVLTTMAFVLAALAALGKPPSLFFSAGFLALYLGLICAGVMNLRWRVFGDAVCSVPEASGQLALTFDDGPDPVFTREVLTSLRRAKAHATFFVVGSKAAAYPELLREIVAEGHALGIHSYAHDRLYAFLPPSEVKRDIERCRDVIYAAVGQRPVWFRPPIGQLSPRTAAGVLRADAVTVGWSVRARDGLRSTTREACLARVVAGLDAGAIVLLHDAWERADAAEPGPERSVSRCPAGVSALDEILSECRARGLVPVTIAALVSRA